MSTAATSWRPTSRRSRSASRAACAAAGRSRDEITLVVVTKTYPASDVDLLAELGVTDIGENRHPEAEDKWAEVTAPDPPPLRGRAADQQGGRRGALRRRRAERRPAKLARSLSRGAEAAGRELGCLVQVDFGPEVVGSLRVPIPPTSTQLADLIAGRLPDLRLDGVMTVAPLGVDPRPVFDQLVALAARTARPAIPAHRVVSAGMSDDFEAAVEAGATHLRVGRSILGERPPLR